MDLMQEVVAKKQPTVQPLMRPAQVEETTEERDRIETMLRNYGDRLSDPGESVKTLRRLDHMLETQAPQPFEHKQLDEAIKRERELREEILEGMPTQAEMRRKPHGAVDKHMQWEQRNKQKLLEWKHIRLRMHASGVQEGVRPAFDQDVANFEQYRPAVGAPGELSLDGSLIPGKTMLLPEPGAEFAVVMNDAQQAKLAQVSSEILLTMGLRPASERREILDMVDQLIKLDADGKKKDAQGGKKK